MATKRPLVNNAGQLQEIASGDLLPLAILGTGTPDAT